jgi:hypothetical protein
MASSKLLEAAVKLKSRGLLVGGLEFPGQIKGQKEHDEKINAKGGWRSGSHPAAVERCTRLLARTSPEW